MEPIPGVRRFFSLKWKALLLTSLVLITVTVAISWRSFVNLNDQFVRDRQADHARYQRDIQVLIEQSLDGLLKLGSVIPSLPNMQEALASGDLARIHAAFDPQWPVLQLDWGIDLIGVYDSNNQLLDTWETAEWGESLGQQVLDWVRQVNETETPLLAVNCRVECMHYVAVPILANGRSAGVVLVASSLGDVVGRFSEVSGNDIGLLVLDEACHEDAWIADWSACVVALTDRARNLRLLAHAAQQPLDAVIGGIRSTLNGRSAEIKLIPLPDYQGDKPAYSVVIADVTGTLASIRAATQEVFLVGGVGWLTAELLLLLILWTPMSRLRETAGHLPLLAQSQFQTVRSVIFQGARQHWLKDEIDVLESTAIALADRLELLESEVAAHTQALSRRMGELARERDFVASLLNTAQIMIVTQDRQGRIVMTNPFVRVLTGYDEQDLVGRDFVDALFAQRKRDLRRSLQEELVLNQREHLRHEALVNCKDGSIRNVTWYHSWLSGRSADDPVILSVGLDITERRGAESRLAWLADHDTLTSLMNRRRFQDELELALAAAQRQGKTGALLLIDLDQFKYINDTCGHHNGDALLKMVGSALVNDLLTADAVARLGGDEFALLLREGSAEEAVRLAGAVNALIGSVELKFGEQILRVSASIGIVLFPLHADNLGELLACADLAMYQAKEEGRNHWHIFSEDDKARERMRHRVYWRDKVAQALAEDRFSLCFQPIMSVATGRIAHYEALLRMRGDDGDLISPVHFIDAAERGGIIHAVDRLVVSKAIRQLGELNRLGMDVSFSINLSGRAFSDPQLLDHIRQELAQHQVNSSRITFEITETAAVSDFAVANSLMLAVKELGCRFALDDFGIGFSSFYYLKHLPVDLLKIDGSFIRQLPDSLDDQVIVRAITQVAAGFGKKIVAEYVENELTLDLLREYGIDFAQGYHIGRPLAAEQAFPALARAHPKPRPLPTGGRGRGESC